MRWAIAMAALVAATPLSAQRIAIDRSVYRERSVGGAMQVEPATQLLRGDRVVTILSWDAPQDGSYTVVSPVPAGLTVQSASHPNVEISSDGGRSWQRLADPQHIPAGITHLRWRLEGSGGRLSYRSVVR
ncbi:hypothetical protein [Altererythrobacter sp. Root672]|uniref:hypothetical protein n=1 Tax=Altererythrobacter sp. Root672 TaxID=1736584 RepID=UPI000701CE47|nr:hypothetical protein [Altererythrobacter sp. Root672]KRA83214.1 hypothetical protein ASD76_03885 [Altererythrobacter sp. Root672]